MTRRVVVVGNGMAGTRFVQELVRRDADVAITLVGDEPGEPYNRMQLSNVLAGTTRAESIGLVAPGWFEANAVRTVVGHPAVRIDRPGRTVRLRDGSTLPYDELVLASGSAPVLPPLPGLVTDAGLVPGAALFRTADDCARIDTLARAAGRAVVLGAGVLGIEAARGLAGRGLAVTLVQRGPRLMERQLDVTAARLLRRSLADLGIEVVTGSTVARVDARPDRLAGVTLDDGRRLAAELLVLCCGVRPRVELARDAGLTISTGVVVDDRLRSIDDPAIRVIGEVAEHRGRTHGLVAPAWQQAAVAAEHVADPHTPTRYAGTSDVTRLKATGLELAALGESLGEDDADGIEVVRFSDTGRGVYQKLVVREGTLVGAILLGDTRTAGTVTQILDRAATLPRDLAALLMPRRAGPAAEVHTPVTLPARATVCQCNNVTKAAITSAWQDGARSVAQIAERTRATTGCGTCRDIVCGIVEWLADSDPVEDPLG
jgi:assimilatory nitrate reductase electron transfer subunit